MGGIVGLIIQLVARGVGGNVAGSMLKQYDLGTVGNTIAGVVGGGVGAQIIGSVPRRCEDVAGGGSLDIGSIIGQIASGGVGGGVLMVISRADQAGTWADRRPPEQLTGRPLVSQHTIGRRAAL